MPGSDVPALAGAPLYTLLHKSGSVTRSSRIGRFMPVSFGSSKGRTLLPLPASADAAGSGWKLPPATSCLASATASPRRSAAAGTPHLCYCFTPMRYAWHMQRAYFADSGSADSVPASRPAARAPSRLGPAHRPTCHALHRHQPHGPASESLMLRSRQHRHLSARRYRLLLPGGGAARGFYLSCRRSPRTSASTWRFEPAND